LTYFFLALMGGGELSALWVLYDGAEFNGADDLVWSALGIQAGLIFFLVRPRRRPIFDELAIERKLDLEALEQRIREGRQREKDAGERSAHDDPPKDRSQP
jgi:hypothetical protein